MPRSSSVVVLGAGGHAKVIIELFRANHIDVDFCIADAGPDGTECLGVPVLVGDYHLERLSQAGYRRAFVAIGSNRLRETLAAHVIRAGFELVSVISPAATVSPSAIVGSGVAVMAGAVINASARIGDTSIINTLASVDHDCVVGVAVHIAPRSAVAGSAIIHNRAFLGIGSSVIPGITIGEDAVVGAGAAVVHDVDARATVVGVPARRR